MLNLDVVTMEMAAAKPYYQAVTPGTAYLFKGTWFHTARSIRVFFSAMGDLKRGASVAEMTGNVIGGRVTRAMCKPIRAKVVETHKYVRTIEKRDPFRKNGMGGRSWYNSPRREKMVIVFHDANRAGPHIDVHLGRLSVVYRVKPDLYSELKYKRDGMLTDESKKLIIDHVRSEIATGSRVPQNLDHSRSNAKASWTGGDPEATTYGSGKTRQVVVESDVDIFKAHENGPIEMYAPLLNPHRALYMYKLYKGDEKRAPILIWGAKSSNPPKLDDRLHLKMIDPKEEDKLNAKVDLRTSTAKYDGASGYVVVGPKGTTVWSPRQSVKTGEQIEYTHKLDGLGSVTNPETVVGMGEILFKEKPRFPWENGRTLSAAEIGGILNSNRVLPKNLKPEVRLYRIDRWGREKVGDLPFWENRSLQEHLSTLMPERLKVVELMDPATAARKGFEGIVAAPTGASVNEGFKVKWWTDPHDWRIDKVKFEYGDKGGIAGVIQCTSLESGKTFKLGPGQVGDRDLTTKMMADPAKYEGSVIKVESRHGHEGRAAKMLGFHDDKGLAPV